LMGIVNITKPKNPPAMMTSQSTPSQV
jgi:hypothetical protein